MKLTARPVRTAITTVGVGIALALAGCSAIAPAGGPATEQPDRTDAAAFVACLKAAGVTAMVGEKGHVLVQRPSETGADGQISIGSDGSGESGPLYVMGDSSGAMWVAVESSAGFSDDPDTQDAYAACEKTFPDFAQPESGPLSDEELTEYQEMQTAAGIEFAQCARDAGFAWVADPDPTTGGAIALPGGLTEDDFRAVLAACYDPQAPLGWSIEGEPGFDLSAVLAEFTDVGTSVSDVRSTGPGNGDSTGPGAGE